MNFGKALQELKNGKKLAREAWENKDARVHMQPELVQKHDDEPVFYISGIDLPNGAPNVDLPWHAGHADLAADDWYVV